MSTPLHRHLLHDHGREPRELEGIPLGAVHRLEHVEDDLGLIELRHAHGHEGRIVPRPRRSVE